MATLKSPQLLAQVQRNPGTDDNEDGNHNRRVSFGGTAL
ncbi:hypothetical protein VTL71DRAFT_11627 [Oculimacula yallundae]|uniref:Photosystem II subunit H n=1 Tax=Oculimacula yallundae TaxID=86028 RepID=A0ABR4CR13_9HELO